MKLKREGFYLVSWALDPPLGEINRLDCPSLHTPLCGALEGKNLSFCPQALGLFISGEVDKQERMLSNKQ
jgi:hypothetical protein